MKYLIQPSLQQLRQALKAKLDELLEPHLSIHPITCNDYLTETVNKIQGHRHERSFDKICLYHCELTSKSSVVDEEQLEASTIVSMMEELKASTWPNVENYSVSLAADVAKAYYQV